MIIPESSYFQESFSKNTGTGIFSEPTPWLVKIISYKNYNSALSYSAVQDGKFICDLIGRTSKSLLPLEPLAVNKGPQQGISLLIPIINKQHQAWRQADFFFLFLASYSIQTRLRNTDNTFRCSRLLLYRRIHWPNVSFETSVV